MRSSLSRRYMSVLRCMYRLRDVSLTFRSLPRNSSAVLARSSSFRSSRASPSSSTERYSALRAAGELFQHADEHEFAVAVHVARRIELRAHAQRNACLRIGLRHVFKPTHRAADADARADAQLFLKALREKIGKIRRRLILRIRFREFDESAVLRGDHHGAVGVALGILCQKPGHVALPFRTHGERETGAVGHGVFVAVTPDILLGAFAQKDAPQKSPLGRLAVPGTRLPRSRPYPQ